jgi:peptidoglycan hydrolase-like protein with peptidoglycan-binding domain
MKYDSAGYTIDLATFKLETLKSRLRYIHMTPSQQILKEDLENRFAILQSHGIHNLHQLQEVLKTRKAVSAFAQASGLPQDYLTVLRRWVNGYHPKPVKLADLPPVDADTVTRLAVMGINDTLQLFPRVKTPTLRAELASESGIPPEKILILTKLSDLCRLKWVGPKFAHLLLVSGFDTVEKIAMADGIALYHHLQKISEVTGVYQGGFGEDDINLWVQYIVCDVPIIIDY